MSKGSLQVNIAGSIFASLFDEAYYLSTKERINSTLNNLQIIESKVVGILYGNKRQVKSIEVSDSDVDTNKIINMINITEFQNYHDISLLIDNTSSIQSILERLDEIIGIVVFRRDGIHIPSFQELNFIDKVQQSSNKNLDQSDYLILIINVPHEGYIQWTHELNSFCYHISKNNRFFPNPVQMTIPSLSKDASKEYNIVRCINSSLNSENFKKDEFQFINKSSIQQSSLLEVSIVNAIDKVVKDIEYMIQLEQEVLELENSINSE